MIDGMDLLEPMGQSLYFSGQVRISLEWLEKGAPLLKRESSQFGLSAQVWTRSLTLNKKGKMGWFGHHSTLPSLEKGVESSSSWLWLPPSPSPSPPPLPSLYELKLFSIKLMRFILLFLIVLQSMCMCVRVCGCGIERGECLFAFLV